MSLNGVVDFDAAGLFGSTVMVLAFLLIFLAIRSQRETVGGGTLTLRRGIAVGLLATLAACAFYVVGWEITDWGFFPDFADRYSGHVIERMHARGESEAAIAATKVEMAHFRRVYRNPAVKVGMSFMEVFPVGLIVTLASATILRRRVAPRRRAPLQPSQK